MDEDKKEEGDEDDDNKTKERKGDEDDKKKEKEDNDVDSWNLNGTSPENYPQQPNGYDCGVYVCCLYDYIAKKTELPVTEMDCFQRRNLIAGLIATRCISDINSPSTNSELHHSSDGNEINGLEVANAPAAEPN